MTKNPTAFFCYLSSCLSFSLLHTSPLGETHLLLLELPTYSLVFFVFFVLCLSVCLRLRQLDVEFMKRLSHSVNIIPVIAKADTMTIEERQEFKQRVSFNNHPTKARLKNQPGLCGSIVAHFRYIST